jgi:hypothetical protein
MAELYEYECALSGLTAPGIHPIPDGDKHGDIPVGWSEVRITRRLLNPRYVAIQQTKRSMIKGLLDRVAGMDEATRQAQTMMVQVQVEAQLHPLLKDTQPFIYEEDIAYLSPPELSPDLMEAMNEAREMLGLEAFEVEQELDTTEQPVAVADEESE